MEIRKLFVWTAVALVLMSQSVTWGEGKEERPPAAPKPGLGGEETPGLLEKHLEDTLADVEEIVFATRGSAREWHFFATTGYDCADPSREFFSRGPGRLVALNLRTKKTRVLLEDPEGAVRYPCVSYDGRRIVFSYRPGGEKVYHLYEINADGTGLRQITDGRFDDVEPIYAPDGGFIFASARCKRFVPCFNSQVQMLYRCDADGSNIRPLSAGQENELTPWMMPDGQIIYMRWEYVERQVRTYHHLWTIRPDGTNEMVYFGNGSNSYVSAPGSVVIIDARPIPGTNKVVAMACSRHGRRNYAGAVTIIDPSEGPNVWDNIKYLTTDPKEGGESWRDPYPLSEDCFLLAKEKGLYVMDGRADYEKIYESDTMVHEPRPLVPRRKETVIPSQVDPSEATGTCVVSEVHVGRNMEGVEAGDVKKVMILEILPKPISGGLGRFRGNGSNLKRVLGTVPVEEDGSAHFKVPAMRAVMFVLLDENDRAIKRMRSFTTLMPGETVGCVGCHEPRTMIKSHPRPELAALQRPPSKARTPVGTPRYGIVDFPRDIQPILDKHCVKCHNHEREHGGLSLSGGATPRDYVGAPRLARMTPLGGNVRGNDAPYEYGSGAGRLLDMLEEGHHEVELSEEDLTMLRLWIETGMWRHGTHAAMALARRTRYSTTDDPRGRKQGYPLMDAALFERRCDSCHEPRKSEKRVWRKTLDDENVNLSTPQHSLLLMAPLADKAGGLGWCRDEETVEKGRGEVFASKTDPDYVALLEEIRELREACYPRGFHFEPGYRAGPVYLREMKRYGVLPADFDPRTPIDPWKIDQDYYELFYPEPEQTARPPPTQGQQRLAIAQRRAVLAPSMAWHCAGAWPLDVRAGPFWFTHRRRLAPGPPARSVVSSPPPFRSTLPQRWAIIRSDGEERLE